MAASPHAKSRRNHFAGYRVSTQTSLRDALLSGTDDGKENRILFLCRRLQKSQNLSSSKKRFFFFVFFVVVVNVIATTTPALSVVVVVFRALSSSSLVVGVVVDSKPNQSRLYDKRVRGHKRRENKKKRGGAKTFFLCLGFQTICII